MVFSCYKLVTCPRSSYSSNLECVEIFYREEIGFGQSTIRAWTDNSLVTSFNVRRSAYNRFV